MVNTTEVQKASLRHAVVQFQLPPGMNGNIMKDIVKTIEQHVLAEHGIVSSVVLIKNAVGQAIYDKGVEAFQDGGLKEGEQYIHSQLKGNIEHLVQECKGNTYFSELDKILRSNSLEHFTRDNKPNFIIRKEQNQYYLKRAYMHVSPYQNDDKQVVVVKVKGEQYPMYLYTFEFSSSEGSPTLEHMFGTKEEHALKSIELIKRYYILQAGWGLPSVGVNTHEGQNWYNQEHVKMRVEGNIVQVIAPHIDHFDTLTTIPVVNIHKEYALRAVSNITQSAPTLPVTRPVTNKFV